jgi:hypothetical protein
MAAGGGEYFMARRTAWRKARPGREQEIMQVCLNQRREDSYGRPLRTFSHAELREMPAAQFARIKADGLLPTMFTPHGPVGWDKNGTIDCRCDECETARADWRKRTGRD